MLESHFTNKKTCSERESKLCKATELVHGRGRIPAQAHWLREQVLR